MPARPIAGRVPKDEPFAVERMAGALPAGEPAGPARGDQALEAPRPARGRAMERTGAGLCRIAGSGKASPAAASLSQR